MRKTIVISARIKEEYMRLIRTGVKRYEIRVDPFDDAQAIRYVGAESGKELGIYRIKSTSRLNRSDEDRLIRMSAIGKEGFLQLFPPVVQGGPDRLWVAEIGEPVTVENLLEEAMS
jgi:hypothetical protein